MDKHSTESLPQVENSEVSNKPYYNVENASPVLVTSQTNKFSRRYDVIKKTIFRKIKKHFTSEFKGYYDYTRRHRRKGMDLNQIMFKKASEFINHHFGPNVSEDVSLILVAMIDVKSKYTHPSPIFNLARKKLLKLIKCFNLFLMEQMMEIEPYKFLVKSCLQDPEFVSEIINNKEDPEVARRYEQQILECLNTM